MENGAVYLHPNKFTHHAVTNRNNMNDTAMNDKNTTPSSKLVRNIFNLMIS